MAEKGLPRYPTEVTERFEVTTWYLEMKSRPALRQPAPPGATLTEVRAPSAHFYRYLYETVGAPWLWVERRRMPDEELLSILLDPDVHLYVAYVDGAPAGYFELDARALGPVTFSVELAYFGLVPDRIGQGLGGWLIGSAIEAAWSLPSVERVWVHTCSLDHPRALSNYEKAGFVRYDQRIELIWDPRPLPISPR